MSTETKTPEKTTPVRRPHIRDNVAASPESEPVLQRASAATASQVKVSRPTSTEEGHLRALAAGQLMVRDFAASCDLGRAARSYLDYYVERGYVERKWATTRGLYSLTEAGRRRLAELQS